MNKILVIGWGFYTFQLIRPKPGLKEIIGRREYVDYLLTSDMNFVVVIADFSNHYNNEWKIKWPEY